MPANVVYWNATLTSIASLNQSLKGIITDVSSDGLQRDFDTAIRAGEMGVVPRPRHFGEFSVSFTAVKFSQGIIKTLWEAVNDRVTLTANAIIGSDAGTNEAYQWSVKGYPSALPLGDLGEDGLSSEFTLMCDYLSISYGTFALIYDPKNNIYSVNGTNLQASVNTLLGV